jgi:hypothetical protein
MDRKVWINMLKIAMIKKSGVSFTDSQQLYVPSTIASDLFMLQNQRTLLLKKLRMPGCS